jgi:hypothetical protein
MFGGGTYALFGTASRSYLKALIPGVSGASRMQTRRKILSACFTGTVALLSGCSAESGDNPTKDQTTKPDESSTQTPTPASTPNDPLPYQNEWTDVNIEKGSGWIHEIPEFDAQAEISYTVTNNSPVNIDVYVFEREGFDSGLDKYTAYIDGGENADGETGINGASDEHADDQAESTGAPLSPGAYAIVVDHSNFEGGLNRARPDEDSPDSISVDVSLEVSSML